MSSSNKLIDVSVPLIPGMPTWPGDGEVQAKPFQRIAEGAHTNVTWLENTSHTGTHLDAPWHFIDDGARLESLALQRMIGPCYVADLTHLEDHVTAEDLESAAIPAGTKRLLLKTRNSANWSNPTHPFDEAFLAVAPSGARWLVAHGIDLIGIDYLSVECFDGDGETHYILLGARLVIVEGLDLRHVEPGPHHLTCLPLRVGDIDGAPCRVVLDAQE
ncbi:MAG TPA: cyclase family protein [Nitrolancea sp.]|nr:cyclase family protein [Nitrolancea sp.]